MAHEAILTLIDAEIAKLTQVRALLANTGKAASKAARLVERNAKKQLAASKGKGKAKAKKARVLSPEARKRIADAQRRRWAAHKAKS